MSLEQVNDFFYFGRDKRLCLPAEFREVFEKTDLKVSCKLMLTLVRVSKQEQSRLGLVVAKKNIRHAVDRNRAKRHIRESFRLCQAELNNLDVVVLVRRGFGELGDREMNQLLERQWLKLRQRADVRRASR